MKKFLISLVLFLGTTNIYADVFIPKEHRVPNRPPGYCVWSCISTLGRNQGITKLFNLVDNRANDPDYVEITYGFWGQTYNIVPKNFGTVGAVKEKLNILGIKYKLTEWNTDHLKEASKNHGCVVFVASTPLADGQHAIILTDYNDQTIEYIDPNDCCYYKGQRVWFDSNWHGITISVEK